MVQLPVGLTSVKTKRLFAVCVKNAVLAVPVVVSVCRNSSQTCRLCGWQVVADGKNAETMSMLLLS